ncbi:hypothetical protein [uncultured Brevundimonas sp.]|uniref:hypothetical protein n=1 Tax=uncultured Brevundimonas sp. TaxID=213418 RepID=UPI0030EDF134
MDIGISRFGVMMGRTRSLVQGAANADPDPMAIDFAKARVCSVARRCRRCAVTLPGRFSVGGNPVRTRALWMDLTAGKAREAQSVVTQTPPFDIRLKRPTLRGSATA